MTIIMIGQKGLPARSGGIERHVSLLASGLVAVGHRVIVYGRSWYVGTGKPPAGVEQKVTRGIHTKHLDAITHTLTALWDARGEHPDIVHLHGSGVEMLTPLARFLFPQAKIVFTFHSTNHSLSKWGNFAKAVLRLSERLGCLFADRTIAVSEVIARYCVKKYGCQATYIPHPFAMPSDQPSVDALADHDLHPNQYLLFVGRLIQDKQAHLLIQAYQAAKHQRPDLFAEIPLAIIGGGAWTDTYVKWLYQLAASVPGVQMLGERHGEELRSLQAHALGHVFPTSSEGLSIAVLEAGSYRQPVVITNLPQNREATGGHAIEVQSQNVQDLSRGLVELAQLSKRDREAKGALFYHHVRTKFDAELRVRDMINVYQELLADVSFLPARSIA
ncbi:MAG: glycosyltransferase family 4 protein [Candidatus Uhrbacteria bacterium]|nr:glycosyltransferase family 4 protein [Candidatus Uhrbacteria bacterium]MDP3793262.1 glycosyltransferase family 4 protein [Candidatus Uhrbacteria bacterium]